MRRSACAARAGLNAICAVEFATDALHDFSLVNGVAEIFDVGDHALIEAASIDPGTVASSDCGNNQDGTTDADGGASCVFIGSGLNVQLEFRLLSQRQAGPRRGARECRRTHRYSGRFGAETTAQTHLTSLSRSDQRVYV